MIVGWNRLEGRPRTVQFDRALRAEVRDALWFLTRQWQFGEFTGEDAGSPVDVRTAVRVDPLQHYAVDRQAAVAYDPAVPLETHVERELIPFDVVVHAQVTRYFWRLIATVPNQAALKAKYLASYPLVDVAGAGNPDRPISGVEDDDARHALQTGRARLLNAADLFEEVASGAYETRVDKFPTTIPGITRPSDAAQDKRDTTCATWFAAQFSAAGGRRRRGVETAYLEYQFAVATDTADRGQTVLIADQYTQGHLDWFAFDVDAAAGAKLDAEGWQRGGADAGLRSRCRSSRCRSRSAACRATVTGRWKAGRSSSPTSTRTRPTWPRLLLTEFALVYGNDWCVIPYELPVGSLSEVVGMLVSDDFGEQSLLLPAGRGLDDRWQRWSMFTMNRSPAGGPADTRFLVPPAVSKLIEAPPLEKVHFLRDEMANMAWGGGARRCPPSWASASAAIPSRSARPASFRPPPPLGPTTAPVRYVLGTDVPYNWIPFIPVHVPGSNRSIQLQRAQMPKVPGVSRAPHTRIVGVPGTPYYINEEEIPRSGKLVTRGYQRARWLNGVTLTWIGRRVTTGRGEGSSGLAFDQIRDVSRTGA